MTSDPYISSLKNEIEKLKFENMLLKDQLIIRKDYLLAMTRNMISAILIAEKLGDSKENADAIDITKRI